MIATVYQKSVRNAAQAGSQSFSGFALAAIWILLAAVGCSQTSEPETAWVAQAPPTSIVAVAPALNFSGSSEFDPVQVADLFASELSQTPGIGVVGVSRVLAVLAGQGVDRIQSPEHALEVAERLGADGIVVFAVTEYDPYTPIVGIAAQLYGRQRPGPQLDPVVTSRMARPFPVISDREKWRPWAQSQRTFNAEYEDVQCDVRKYAKTRNAGDSPHGWKKYLVSQQWFLRFCCYAVNRDLMEQAGGEVIVAAAPDDDQTDKK